MHLQSIGMPAQIEDFFIGINLKILGLNVLWKKILDCFAFYKTLLMYVTGWIIGQTFVFVAYFLKRLELFYLPKRQNTLEV